MSKRRAVIVGIMVLIAIPHILRVGIYFPDGLFSFYYCYFSDIVLPFGEYLLFCTAELQMPFLRRWEVKLAVSFLIPAIAETCQYFGIPVLGTTFDPLDYGMYGLGAMLAAVFDIQVFSRLFHFWSIGQVKR